MRIVIALVTTLLGWSASGGAALAQGTQGACPDPNTLGVARTVEIDTKGAPGFGFEHYKAYDFLRLKEVVLTFDDGPQVGTTHAVLDALAAQCTKATFFPVGKMAAGLPEILRDVAKAGHTIGSHTWAHVEIGKLKDEGDWKAEIEKGMSAVRRAVGGPVAPFFRYPTLKDTPQSLEYLKTRNVAIFSTDIDSFDFLNHNPDRLVKSVISKLEKKGKGIILLHDIQPGTAKALPHLLAELKANGYTIVHLKPKAELTTLAQYDAMIEKDVKGFAAGSDRPISSVVRTIEEAPPTPTAAARAPAPLKK
ncbi:MAG: polysaccharide deacetylase family protein [Hyphomicrobiaceae bacterium]|nr:polysaccharide deacetylase family protein [Hyphomicrobiaceae bacterium]